MVIFLVVLVSALVSYVVYQQDYAQLEINDQYRGLQHTATSLGRLIQFYQGVVDTIAKQHAVVDLLQFGTEDQTHQWVNDMQRLVPDSIGMALFESNGNVRGMLSELRLSEQCLMDMKLRLQGKPVPKPPVHYKIEHLAHFDIVAPVMSANEVIGLVFASFSLKTIEKTLNDALVGHQQLSVIASDGYLIAQTGHVDENVDVYSDVFDVPGTDWVLNSRFTLMDETSIARVIFIHNIVIFLLLTVVFIIALSRFLRIVIADFEITSNMIRHIQDGSFERQKIRHAHLAETEGIIAYMRFLATELSLHQKKIHDASITDELTGLYNRRVLNQEIDRCLEWAKQGESIGLVILDLDHFKIINDTAGHDIGDQILVMLAEVLRENCKEKDICVRVGGDEFIVILFDCDQKKINSWYMSVLNILQQRAFTLKEKIGSDSQCGISAGFTLITPGDDRSSLLKRADLALYEAKNRGRCNIQFAK